MGDGDTVNFTLHDSIIFNNGSQECFARGSVSMAGITNLIGLNGAGTTDFAACPGALTGAPDPKLGPLQLNAPGMTPTMAIPAGSSAQESADAASSLLFDQRGIQRPSSTAGPLSGGYDIGAFELCTELEFGHFLITCSAPPSLAQTEPLTMAVSPAGAGTTTPAVGADFAIMNSIAKINATPNPGYSFLSWIGNVADPNSALTTVIMNAPQALTANFVAGTTVLGGNILTKTGPLNARVWPISVVDSGVVTAHSPRMTLVLTQTGGAACSPIYPDSFNFNDLAPGASATINFVLNFTGCAPNARFTAQATFSANGGGVTGSMSRTNQLP